MVSDRQLKYWFDKYNSKWFGGELPSNILIYWEPPPSAYANTCPVFEVDHGQFCIKVDPAVKGIPFYWRQLILHEMVHVKFWSKHPRHLHGKMFQEEMKRLANDGAFKPLW